MNESQKKIDLNVFDSSQGKDENVNLKTIIIPGLSFDSEQYNALDQIEFNGAKSQSMNDETIIESAEDIFIFTEPGYIPKKPAQSGFTQIPTTFAKENKTKAEAEPKVKKNIFLTDSNDAVIPLTQKPATINTRITGKKGTPAKRELKQHRTSQKSYTFALTTLFLLIVASILFILHLNNTIDLQKFTSGLYKNTTSMFSSQSKNNLNEYGDNLMNVTKFLK